MSKEPARQSSKDHPIEGKTFLGSTKLNDMMECTTKGLGLSWANTASKIAECERSKHSVAPPKYQIENPDEGLVKGSRGPSYNDFLQKESDEFEKSEACSAAKGTKSRK